MSIFNTENVVSVRHWTDRLFSFRTTRTPSFRFRSGQFIMMGVEAEGRPLVRAFSLASAHYEDQLEFFSIKVPDGPLTSRLQHLAEGDSVLVGRKPNIPAHSVCFECKQRGNVCVVVAHGTPCLGPVTHAGCGALCPAHHRGCYGCFGPMETPNAGAQVGLLRATGMAEADVVRAFRTFNSGAPAFIELSQVARPHERRSE